MTIAIWAKQFFLTTNQSSSRIWSKNMVKIVTVSQIIKEARDFWDYRQTKNLITKLVKDGWLIRLKRGLYAISDLSSRGSLSLSPYRIANLLFPDSYVSFEGALQYHGMFDQMLKRIESVSLKAYYPTTLSGVEYGVVITKSKVLFWLGKGWFRKRTRQGRHIRKALIDIVLFHKSRYSIEFGDWKIEGFWRGP